MSDHAASEVLAATAARLNRTPRQPLHPTDLLIHINEIAYTDHPDHHPDQLIPKVRTLLPELPEGATCGEYAALLRRHS